MTALRPAAGGWVSAPAPGRTAAEAFVRQHLGDVIGGDVAGSSRFRGGQAAADVALAGFDVAGYAARRNEVLPRARRGASALSPYIRHGLLSLREVWDHVADGPAKDVRKYRDELLWQEFARHWYAHHGSATQRGVRRELSDERPVADPDQVWDRSMACLDAAVDELHTDGWIVNQTRMWLASHWSVRAGGRWRDGDDEFFRHLLDGSRAANRLGWQWTTGIGSSKHYGFSRWQVEKRAPGLCDRCEHRSACPIEQWPDDPAFRPVDRPAAGGDHFGPTVVEVSSDADDIEAVWLTAESLGHHDPALVAHPDLPAVFVFDMPLLRGLRLSAKRLVFLVETLAELGHDRQVDVAVGDPTELLGGRHLAVTHAPVPGFARRAGVIRPVEIHPWRWLATPTSRRFQSFSAWRRSVRVD